MDCVACLRSIVRRHTYIGVLLNIVLAVWVASFAVIHLRDPNFMTETYCQINSLNKEGEDVVYDELNTICKSDIVLKYTLEDLELYMKKILYIQASLGLPLAVSGVLAIVGLCRTGTGTCLMNIWLFFNGLWCVSLAVSAGVLWHVLSYHRYANTLLVILVFSVGPFLGIAVEYFWQKKSRQGSYKLPEAVPMQDIGGSEYDETKAEDADDAEAEDADKTTAPGS